MRPGEELQMEEALLVGLVGTEEYMNIMFQSAEVA